MFLVLVLVSSFPALCIGDVSQLPGNSARLAIVFAVEIGVFMARFDGPEWRHPIQGIADAS